MKTLTILAFALASSLASAATLDCQHVGKIIMNGDSALITYSKDMGFTDNQDTAYFVSMNATESVYQANKWGAYITIPNTLLDGRASLAVVNFATYDDPYKNETCSAQ